MQLFMRAEWKYLTYSQSQLQANFQAFHVNARLQCFPSAAISTRSGALRCLFFINHLHASRLGRHTDFPTTLLSSAPRTRSNELSEIEHSSSLPIDQNTGQRRRKPIGRHKMSLHCQFQRITRPKGEWTTSRHLNISEKNPTPGNVRAVQ